MKGNLNKRVPFLEKKSCMALINREIGKLCPEMRYWGLNNSIVGNIALPLSNQV